MPTGVTYWQFPDEEHAFLDFIQGTGDVIVIPSELVDSPGAIVAYPPLEYIRQYDPDQVLLGLHSLFDKLIVEPVVVGGKQKYCVAPATSPLMRYRRGKFRDTKKLGQFNISASWKRLTEAKTALVDKDPDFKKWAEKVIRWVRTSAPDWHEFKGYRVSRRVKTALLQGELEIVP